MHCAVSTALYQFTADGESAYCRIVETCARKTVQAKKVILHTVSL